MRAPMDPRTKFDRTGWTPRSGPCADSLARVNQAEVLTRPVPGSLWPWVKRASWVELAIFSALVAAWLLPGLEDPTMILGWTHGIGYLALLGLIWAAILRHEAPYTLLAASLTPVGPLGSVIMIERIERRNAAQDGQVAGAGPWEAGDPHGPRQPPARR
jgi:hypothetical protein